MLRLYSYVAQHISWHTRDVMQLGVQGVLLPKSGQAFPVGSFVSWLAFLLHLHFSVPVVGSGAGTG